MIVWMPSPPSPPVLRGGKAIRQHCRGSETYSEGESLALAREALRRTQREQRIFQEHREKCPISSDDPWRQFVARQVVRLEQVAFLLTEDEMTDAFHAILVDIFETEPQL